MPVKAKRAKVKQQDGGSKAVAAYLAALPKDSRAALQRLRKDIRAAAPGATELIAWGMPAFKQARLLVGYAAFKEHCSLFPMSLAVMHKFATELKDFSTTKGSVHFTTLKPIPAALVRRIVKTRIAENDARQQARSRS